MRGAAVVCCQLFHILLMLIARTLGGCISCLSQVYSRSQRRSAELARKGNFELNLRCDNNQDDVLKFLAGYPKTKHQLASEGTMSELLVE